MAIETFIGGGIISLNGMLLSTTALTPPAPGIPPYVVPSAIPLSAMSHGAAAVNPIHTSFPGFARGQMTPGMKLVGSIGGTTFPVQQDQTTYWSDGSVRASRVAFQIPATLAADTVTSLTVSPVSGTPNTTPFITPAAMATAHDFQLRAFGLDCGATTYVTSFADIVTNGPRDTWGANPLQGWDVPISGPTEVMVRAWSMRKSGGAYSRWIRDTMYVSAKIDGSYEVAARVEMPIWDRPHPGGTLGNAVSSDRMCHYVELYDGAGARLYAWGGPNDPRTVTVASASIFQPQAGATDAAILPALDLSYQTGSGFTVAAASGGVLPTGLTAGTIYYVLSDGNGGRKIVSGRGGYSGNYAGLTVQFTDAGTGNVIITPFVLAAFGSGPLLLDAAALPVRLGGPARGVITYGWDETYMSRGARLFPCYVPNGPIMTRYPATDAGYTVGLYYPTQPFGNTLWLNTTGDGASDNRIGYLNLFAAQSLLLPHDLTFKALALRDGALWSDQPIWWREAISGRHLITDNGPDNVGGAYPGLQPSRPNASMLNNFGTGGGTWLGVAGGPSNLAGSGYNSGYNGRVMLEGSHRPSPYIYAAHVTGHPMYSDQGPADCTEANFFQASNVRNIVVGSTTFYGIIGSDTQPRGQAWLIRVFGYAETFTPSSVPERAFISHSLDTLAAYGTALVASNAPGISIGLIAQWGGGGGITFQTYQNAFRLTAMSMEVMRGDRPAFRQFAAVIASSVVGLVNTSNNGTPYYIDTYANANIDVNIVTTKQQLINALYGNTAVAPFPTSGFQGTPFTGPGINLGSNGGGPAPYVIAATCAAASAGIISSNGDDALAVYNDVMARSNTAPFVGLLYSAQGGIGNHDYNHNYWAPCYAYALG